MANESEKAAEATEIVHQYMLGSFAAQILPSLPLLDQAVQSGVQLQLIRRLAKHYGVEFPSQRARTALQELVGIGPGGIAINLLKNMITQTTSGETITHDARELIRESINEGTWSLASRFASSTVPGAKFVINMSELIEPLTILYAVGRIFILHFESGGTICSFDASLVKEQFEHEIQIGRKIVESKFGRKDP